MSFAIGENVGPYRIVAQLGQGGMATVFKAYHAALDRYVAIKVLHPAFKEDPNFGMSIPEHVEGVPDEVLNQRSLWKDQSAYEAKAKDLAQRFAKNFQRFEAHAPELAKTGGPKL